MPKTDSTAPAPVPLHEEVYAELRRRLITGRIVPGVGLSTRGLAEELGVSQMPVREALSRLAADGAVEIRSKRRAQVTPMSPQRFDDLLRCRLLLEPNSARLALPHIDKERLVRLRHWDNRMEAALKGGDVNDYMEGNYHFHFTLYAAHPGTLQNRLIETLWLQFGPFMRVVYGRFGTSNLVDQHVLALDAIEAGDEEALAAAIHQDIADGMGLIGRTGLVDL